MSIPKRRHFALGSLVQDFAGQFFHEIGNGGFLQSLFKGNLRLLYGTDDESANISPDHAALVWCDTRHHQKLSILDRTVDVGKTYVLRRASENCTTSLSHPGLGDAVLVQHLQKPAYDDGIGTRPIRQVFGPVNLIGFGTDHR